MAMCVTDGNVCNRWQCECRRVCLSVLYRRGRILNQLPFFTQIHPQEKNFKKEKTFSILNDSKQKYHKYAMYSLKKIAIYKFSKKRLYIYKKNLNII